MNQKPSEADTQDQEVVQVLIAGLVLDLRQGQEVVLNDLDAVVRVELLVVFFHQDQVTSLLVQLLAQALQRLTKNNHLDELVHNDVDVHGIQTGGVGGLHLHHLKENGGKRDLDLAVALDEVFTQDRGRL